MTFFAKTTKRTAMVQPEFVGVAYIKECETTLAREDVQRLKINLEEADREVAGVVSKLARVRAYERDLLVDEKVMTEKRDGLARIYKVKVRALFDLEQDGGF